MTGQTLAHYQILEKIGEGGMGVVYKARDTHLDRFVAIKILPPEKVADPERKARFVREAKAASALNHPNIITVHDIASDNGRDFIVMEYIAGKTLADLIPRHGMRLNDALNHAVQIAGALARAHSAGILHRDIKPANIMVDDHGLAKVLDFGLAKLTETVSSDELATRTFVAGTEEGKILGTVAYVSPEQAQGKPLDARSDLFSFGALLYEMLTGRRAFAGENNMSTLTLILHENPKPPSELVPDLPRDLDRLIQLCLKKDPSRRFQHAEDIGVALEALKEDSSTGRLEAVSRPPRASRQWWIAGAVALVILLAGAWWFLREKTPASQALVRVTPLTTYPGAESYPSLSPEGNQVAFSWVGEKQDNADIYVRLVAGGPPLRLTTDPAPDLEPAWSPDGNLIAFRRRDTVYVVSPLGGPERKITTAYGATGSWSPDSKSLVVPDRERPGAPGALYVISLVTGQRRALTTPRPMAEGDGKPAWSPDGRYIAFVRGENYTERQLMLVPLVGGELRSLPATVLSRYGNPFWTPDSRELLFSQPDGIWRIPIAGETKPRHVEALADGVAVTFARAPIDPPWRAVVQRGAVDIDVVRVSLDTGKASQATSIAPSTRQEMSPQISPDGTKVLFVSLRTGTPQIWLSGFDGLNPVQLTNLPHIVGSPAWSPDGRLIAFDGVIEGNSELFTMPAEGGPVQRLTREQADDSKPTWSQDGKWIYFMSDRAGSRQVWKMLSGGGPAIQITRLGGLQPMESLDGKRVFYSKMRSGQGVWSVSVDGGAESSVLDSAWHGGWGLCEKGIYYVHREPGSATADSSPLMFYDFATGKISEAGILEQPGIGPAGGLSLTRDCRWLVYGRVGAPQYDLALVENFR